MCCGIISDMRTEDINVDDGERDTKTERRKMAERSKARVSGRFLAEIAVQIPPGVWMFLLCV